MYHGDIRLGDTIDIKFCTVNTSGVPTALAGTPVISAYVGNGLTEITAGVTLTVDFDARTGLNNVRVVASGANGFATGTDVQLVITTGTVGGSSVVGYVVGTFSIENRILNAAKIDTDAITSAKVAASAVDEIVNAVWDELTSEARVASSFGQKLKDLTVTAAGRVDVGLWLGVAMNALIAGRVDSNAQVVNDKTGYDLAAAAINSIYDELTSEARVAGSYGQLLKDKIAPMTFTNANKLDAAILAAADLAQAAADKVFGSGAATLPELPQAIPPATPRPDQAMMLYYMALRNLLQVTTTEKRITNDAGTVIAKKALSDNGTTYAEAEMVAGP